MGNERRRRILFYGINILLPLLVGGIIYVVFRRDSYIAAFFSETIGINIGQHMLPEWLNTVVRNYLSDVLWAYSLTFALSALFKYNRRNTVIVFMICIVFVVAIELLQMTNTFSGTFDIVDIILEAIAVSLALLIIKHFEEEHHEKDNQNP